MFTYISIELKNLNTCSGDCTLEYTWDPAYKFFG